MLSRLVVQSQPMISLAFTRTTMQKLPIRNQMMRQLHHGEREAIKKPEGITQRLKELVSTPARLNGVLAGGSVIGFGALCYYGLNISKDSKDSKIWPQYIRDRFHDTYLHLGSSVAIITAASVAVLKAPALQKLLSRNKWVSLIGTSALAIGSGMVTLSMPYKTEFGAKYIAWLLHCASIGAVLFTLSTFGGAIVIRAAIYSAGIIGGLSTIECCAPSEKYMYIGGYLGICLGVVLASSVGSMFYPVLTVLGEDIYSMSLIGGLLLLSAFVLYDTKRVVDKAQALPENALQERFDPINAAISLYLNASKSNSFIRMYNDFVADDETKLEETKEKLTLN